MQRLIEAVSSPGPAFDPSIFEIAMGMILAVPLLIWLAMVGTTTGSSSRGDYGSEDYYLDIGE